MYMSTYFVYFVYIYIYMISIVSYRLVSYLSYIFMYIGVYTLSWPRVPLARTTHPSVKKPEVVSADAKSHAT